MTKALAPPNPKPLRLAVAGGFFGLALLGASVAVTELRAYLDTRGNVPAAQLLGRGQPLSLSLGQQVTAQTITACLVGLDALSGPLYTPAARSEGAGRCLETAQQVLRRAPTHAGARQLLAESLFVLHQPQAAAQALQQAARLAPATKWLAQRRLMLLSRLDPALRTQAFPDTGPLIAQLIAEDESRDWLARQHSRDPAVRAVVEAGAAALPEADARKFLAMVKAHQAALHQGGPPP